MCREVESQYGHFFLPRAWFHFWPLCVPHNRYAYWVTAFPGEAMTQLDSWTTRESWWSTYTVNRLYISESCIVNSICLSE